MGDIARIPVRGPEDVWTFTQRNLSLWDVLDVFPSDAIGPRGPKDPPPAHPVRPLTVETDLGFTFESDIQYGTWMFRPRSPKEPGMMRWCREAGLEPGDVIVFERVGDHRYRLRLEKGAAS
jgi:hypothetical protein